MFLFTDFRIQKSSWVANWRGLITFSSEFFNFERYQKMTNKYWGAVTGDLIVKCMASDIWWARDIIPELKIILSKVGIYCISVTAVSLAAANLTGKQKESSTPYYIAFPLLWRNLGCQRWALTGQWFCLSKLHVVWCSNDARDSAHWLLPQSHLCNTHSDMDDKSNSASMKMSESQYHYYLNS